jgi:hypothetical protein
LPKKWKNANHATSSGKKSSLFGKRCQYPEKLSGAAALVETEFGLLI